MPILNADEVTTATSATAQLASVPLTEARPTGVDPSTPPPSYAGPGGPKDYTGPTAGADRVLAAAAENTNFLGSAYNRFIRNPDSTAPAVPGYSAVDDIHGYEQDQDRFVRSTSPEQTQVIKNRLDLEHSNQAVLAAAGGWGTAASFAMGALDPMFIAAMAVPGLGEVAGAGRIAKIGALVGTNVALGEAQAGAVAATQETGDYTRGIIPRIAGSALLAGVLGTIMPGAARAEVDDLGKRVGDQVNSVPGESTAGAMAAGPTLKDLDIARGGYTAQRTLGITSPMSRIMTTSDNVEARKLALQFVETPAALAMNERGIATPSSIESVVQQARDTRDYKLSSSIDKGMAELKAAGTPMSRGDFNAAVTEALNNSDKHDIPQVQTVAQQLRPFFSQDSAALIKHDSLSEDFKLVGDPSYGPRVYNAPVIMKNRAGLEQALFDHFTHNPKTEPGEPVETKLANTRPGGTAADSQMGAPLKDTVSSEIGPKVEEKQGPPAPIYRTPLEVKDDVHRAMDNILGSVRGTADFGNAKSPGPLHDRAIDAPYSVLKPWLSTDIEHVFHGYNKSILPHIEMLNRFGTTDLKTLMGPAQDRFHAMLEGEGSAAGKQAITNQHNATLTDLEGLHARVLEQAGSRVDSAQALVRTARVALTYNYVRELGGAPVSAISDISRMIGRYGLGNTMGKLAKFAADTKMLGGKGLMAPEARRLGTAFDVALHTRAKSLGELVTEPGGSKTENYATAAANAFTRGTLMAPYDEMLRTVTASLEQDAIGRMVLALEKDRALAKAAGLETKGGMSNIEKLKFGSTGIGEAELDRISKMWTKHGGEENGMQHARTELWEDQGAARIVEQSVVRSASRMAFHIGKGDMPLMMSSKVAQLLLQFKSFALTAPGRVLTPMAQGIAHGDIKAVSGITSSLILGGLTYYFKEIAAGNNKPDMSATRLASEAVGWSGLLGVVPDIYSTLAPIAGLPTQAKYSDRTLSEAMAGPAMGTAISATDTLHHMITKGANAGDIHRMRMLLPFQNVWYLRRLIDGVEGKFSDLLNVPKATHQTFAEHVLQDRTPGTPGGPKTE